MKRKQGYWNWFFIGDGKSDFGAGSMVLILGIISLFTTINSFGLFMTFLLIMGISYLDFLISKEYGKHKKVSRKTKC